MSSIEQAVSLDSAILSAVTTWLLDCQEVDPRHKQLAQCLSRIDTYNMRLKPNTYRQLMDLTEGLVITAVLCQSIKSLTNDVLLAIDELADQAPPPSA